MGDNDNEIAMEEMSDEQFSEMDVNDILMTEPVDPDEGEPVDTEEESEASGVEDTQTEETEEGNLEETEDDAVGGDDGQPEDDTDTQDAGEETDEGNDFDFQAGYEEIMAPLRADGREVTPKSADDVRKLMQMGYGFSGKMKKLKPYLKVIKSLKDNNLLDQGKIDHLIDLSKKDPNAIAKLLKDGKIDPLDIDTQKAGDYKPKNYEVSDIEFNLDQAIEAIRGNDTFDQTMNVMGEQWDEDSRNLIVENPEIIGIIDGHMRNGVFERIQGFVDNERAFGRLTDISDFDAYRNAAQILSEQGVVVQRGQDTQSQDDTSDENPLKKEASKGKAARRKAKKKAAAPSGGRPKSKEASPDLSKLSDEDFLKQFDTL